MDVRKLLVLYRNNQCTEEEAKWLIKHIKSGKDRELLEQFIEEDLHSPLDETFSVENADTLKEVFANIIHNRQKTRPKSRIFAMWYFQVAATILLVSTIIAAIYLQTRAKPKAYLAQTKLKSTPKHLHESTLTLGDGRVIALAKVASGEIGGTADYKINKTADNLLEYIQPKGLERNKGKDYNTLTVSRGDTYRIRLSDGTMVWLNAGSSLTYPSVFNAKDRAVELKGEGYFEVIKNPGKPFRVKSRDMEITVLGTSFNVNAYTDEPALQTTLIEGSVKLKGPKNGIAIKPGDQAGYDNHGLFTVTRVNPDLFLGWKHGVFRFSGNSFDVIMRQIARWHDLKLEYKNGKVPDIKIGGEMPRTARLAEVIDVLKGSGVNLVLNKNTIVINP